LSIGTYEGRGPRTGAEVGGRRGRAAYFSQFPSDGTRMVLQIVLPEPTNDVNRHRSSGGGGGVGIGNKHNSTNISHHHNLQPHHNPQPHPQDPAEPWLRRAPSVNSLTESRIGEDSLFSYPYGKGRKTNTPP
jgi:hypothetical protein